MGDFSEFSLATRALLFAYRWRRVDPVPWTPLRKPLRDCKVGIVSTAGFVTPEQPPFDGTIRGGDWSHRVIPSSTDVTTLIDTQRSDSFDHSGMQADANLAFPLDRLRELAHDSRIGSVAGRHLSFMGSITAPNRLIKESAPAAAQTFVDDGVDVALLVPV